MTEFRPALHSDGSGRKIVEVYDEDGTLLGTARPCAAGTLIGPSRCTAWSLSAW